MIATCAAFIVLHPLAAQTARAPEAPPPATEASQQERLAWIKANPTHSALADVLERVIEASRTVDAAIALGDLLAGLPAGSVRHDATVELARIARTAHRPADAARLFGAAYEVSGRSDLESLFCQAQMLFELNDVAGADERVLLVIAQTKDYSLKRRATTLAARIRVDRGQLDVALKLLDTLAALDDAQYVEPETLLLRLRVARMTGNSDLESSALAQLTRLFPQSAVAASESGSQIVQAGLPSALGISERWSSSTLVEEAQETRDRLQPAITAVQVGSFSDPDNAEHLARDVRGFGLEAVTESVVRDGRSVVQVLVPISDGSASSAARAIGVLRDHGLDGFLVY